MHSEGKSRGIYGPLITQRDLIELAHRLDSTEELSIPMKELLLRALMGDRVESGELQLKIVLVASNELTGEYEISVGPAANTVGLHTHNGLHLIHTR